VPEKRFYHNMRQHDNPGIIDASAASPCRILPVYLIALFRERACIRCLR
jgi:hypothetical protein